MDIERGSLEVLFKEIPYDKVTVVNLDTKRQHDFSTVNQSLYMEYSHSIFAHYTEDERRNNYLYLQQEIKNNIDEKPNIFRFVMNISKRLLTYQAGEIKCKFAEMLRWREISFQLGQDFFTCALLADLDLHIGKITKYFAWLPIIRSDDERLHNILDRGMAENHFHLGGSTKIFELNWICLMNLIENRMHDFAKIKESLRDHNVDLLYDYNAKETFYMKCQKAALYRIYLFMLLKEDTYMKKKLREIDEEIQNGVPINLKTTDIQDIIELGKRKYGAKVDDKYILDYALEKDMIDINNNECRLLAGERRFLYECYKACVTDIFNFKQKNIFYMYLILRTFFRSELIQVNRQVGFANFKKYQDRKEYFIEGEVPYEKELVRLALNASMQKQKIVSLEARICPSNKSSGLYEKVAYFNKIAHIEAEKAASSDIIAQMRGEKVEKEKEKKNLIYVLHFPKSEMEEFCYGLPRNYKVRNRTYIQTKAIVALLEKGTIINHQIRGIDACSSENACRPEVFAQYYRYLTDIIFATDSDLQQILGKRCSYANLHATYHVGEDFLDIVDGLRAIDEAILFCGLRRGSRIGHGLALGVDTYQYYKYKAFKLVLPKQDLLDDIVWMLVKIDETGCNIESRLKCELETKYYSLFHEIYGTNMKEEGGVSYSDYYNSWQLRGDYPSNYRINANDFLKKMNAIQISRIARYEFNSKVSNEIRKVKKYSELYFLYHYSEEVRTIGKQKTDFKVDCRYAGVVKELQDKMIQQLVSQGIGIETNPSSNFLIGTIQKYEEHPIVRFNSRKLNKMMPNMSLNVSINTDDQGVFDTLLENEYALMALALKKAKDKEQRLLYDVEDIYEWIDYVRKMGIEQVFQNGMNETY